jgi:hypothetical protein
VALVLDRWSRADQSGISLARRGIGNLKSAGSFARMPYWLSLLADLSARGNQAEAALAALDLLADLSARGNQAEAALAALDTALAGGLARDDLWWLPEVMRTRAGYDDDEAAVSRLRSAAEMATAHGSAALVRRCERDLAQRGGRRSAPGVLPTA